MTSLLEKGEKYIYQCDIYIGEDSIEIAKKIIHNSKDLSNFIKDIIYKYNCNLQDQECANRFHQSAKYLDYINEGYKILKNKLRTEINDLKVKE